jgi:GT2 family glycosyltransferase
LSSPDSRVTIAIPTLAGGSLLASCLKALKAQTFTDFEVIIVNNGNGPIELANSALAHSALPFPIRVLTPGSNLGFGAAMNLAARASSSPFLATLNDDTEPDPEWLFALVQEMELNPRVGMTASRIRLFESERLDSAGMLICLDGSSKQRGRAMPDNTFIVSEDALLPSACAALYSRKMFDEIGFFDEEYFLYCEDTDLGLRAQWAGWRCRYVATATVRHHYSRTAGAFSPLKARFVERNRLWVAIKNFPAFLLPLVPIASFVRYFWQFTAAWQRRGAAGEFVKSGHSAFAVASILVQAHWETLLKLPLLLRKRAVLRRTRKITSAEFARLLRRHSITARELGRA